MSLAWLNERKKRKKSITQAIELAEKFVKQDFDQYEGKKIPEDEVISWSEVEEALGLAKQTLKTI